ncbi:hypothetical protein OIU83_06670 [Flavobacterium sp. LS1R49]|uniref:Uncharacterized protein n=1 Tax=Flavobacterium shii TaxID=2987687 RepID=A0A9X3BY28_9FLAO|nr:hypothetical protein [Flavobacterium shii]
MKTTFKIVEFINIVALLFLILGGYGLAITGALQVITAIFFFLLFPKNKLIYIYFGLVITFFLIWDRHTFNWLFLLPASLIFFLTYIIYNQKSRL